MAIQHYNRVLILHCFTFGGKERIYEQQNNVSYVVTRLVQILIARKRNQLRPASLKKGGNTVSVKTLKFAAIMYKWALLDLSSLGIEATPLFVAISSSVPCCVSVSALWNFSQ